MTMIEKAAREAHREWYECGRQIPPLFPIDRFEVERWKLLVRAVLAAIREPDEAMENAMATHNDDQTFSDADAMWRAGIDAILQQEPK